MCKLELNSSDILNNGIQNRTGRRCRLSHLMVAYMHMNAMDRFFIFETLLLFALLKVTSLHIVNVKFSKFEFNSNSCE